MRNEIYTKLKKYFSLIITQNKFYLTNFDSETRIVFGFKTYTPGIVKN